jgi:FKBP-type peptidyl-prolyl cis-trans isomerase FklB
MKSGFIVALGLTVATFALPLTVSADDTATPAGAGLTNKADRLSYSVGLYIANNIIKRNSLEVDVDMMAQAIRDVMSGSPTKLTDQQAQETLRGYEQELRAKREEQRVKLAEKNRLAGEQFLAANKQQAGVKTHSVKISENSTAELQYKVLAEGAGESPKATDMAVVNWKASNINGKEFETANTRKTPVNRLPQGLSEALQMMKPGAKWQLFLPSTLAFGDFGSGGVEPGAAVIYDFELVSVETPQPLTSDIVMVPSVEHMKAGSNIVVIKPSEIAKYTNAAPAQKTSPPAPPKK